MDLILRIPEKRLFMKRYYLTSIFTCIIFLAFGQVEFIKNSHEFGKIKELDGPVEVEYKFVNKGQEPIILSGVRASCGCTSTGYTKDPIAQGDTGYVKASFNPSNRPGHFTKSVTVTTNSTPSTYTLTFKGFVIAKQNTLEQEFPFKVGSLRFSGSKIDLGKFTTNGPDTRIIKIYNDGITNISFPKNPDVPSHLSVDMPESILPGQTGEVKITYNPQKKNDFGPVEDKISIYTSELESAKKDIVLSAVILDYFPAMPEAELAKLQKLELTESLVDFGIIKKGTTSVKEIEIRNVGKMDLIIRKMLVNSNYIKVDLDKRSIKPGGKAKIKVTYNSLGQVGKDSKQITLYTNDPKNPQLEFTVLAESIN